MSYILGKQRCDVSQINFQIQNIIAGELMTYKSIDSVVLAKMLSLNIQRHFILTAGIARITAYNNLQLTVGSIIIMLRNIDLPRLRIMVSTGLAIKNA